jgi:hypothetical protein
VLLFCEEIDCKDPRLLVYLRVSVALEIGIEVSELRVAADCFVRWK